MQLSISTNFPEVKRALETMRSDIANKAMGRSLNRTIEQARTQMVREITKRYTILAREVRESLRIRRASLSGGTLRLEAFLESPSTKGRSRNLIHFRAKQVKDGVSVQIIKGAGRKVIRSAFIANKGKNKAGGTVFVRTGKKRLPIEPVTTIGVPQMFNTQQVNAAVVQTMLRKFPEIFEREARYYTQRAAGGRR